MRTKEKPDLKWQARLRMMRALNDLHELAQALDDSEDLGDVLDEALGLVEVEARAAIQNYIAELKASQAS